MRYAVTSSVSLSVSLSLFLIVSLSVCAPQHVSANLPHLSQVSNSSPSLLISLSRVVFLALLFFSLSLTIDFNADHVKSGTFSNPALPHGSGDVDVDGDVDEDKEKPAHMEMDISLEIQIGTAGSSPITRCAHPNL